MGNPLAQSIEEQAMERIQNIIRAYANKKMPMGSAWAKITKVTAATDARIAAEMAHSDAQCAVKELQDALEAEEKDLKDRITKLERAQSDFAKALND